jgi:hypothetical protein
MEVNSARIYLGDEQPIKFGGKLYPPPEYLLILFI